MELIKYGSHSDTIHSERAQNWIVGTIVPDSWNVICFSSWTGLPAVCLMLTSKFHNVFQHISGNDWQTVRHGYAYGTGSQFNISSCQCLVACYILMVSRTWVASGLVCFCRSTYVIAQMLLHFNDVIACRYKRRDRDSKAADRQQRDDWNRNQTTPGA